MTPPAKSLPLFAWTPHGYERAPEADNPRARPCPYCLAPAGVPCSAPDRRRGRRTLRSYHPARTRPTDQQEPT